MYKQKIRFKTIEEVKEFCRAAGSIPCDIDIATAYRHVVDAKSLMGIFSLDLSKPVTVCALTEDAAIIKALKDAIERTGIGCD